MATFTALLPIDMGRAAFDLPFLRFSNTTWTSSVVTFTATSSNGLIKLVGDGVFDNLGGKPDPASLDGLTVTYIDAAPPHIPHTVYTISDIGHTFQELMAAASQPYGAPALPFLLSGDDTITGS